MNKIVVIDEDLCTGCGACVKLCPKKILFLDKTNNVCKVTDKPSATNAVAVNASVPLRQLRSTKITF